MTSVPPKIQQAYGELPQSWQLERLKFFSGVRNSNVDKTVSEEEIPVRLCNYVDVYYHDRVSSDMDFMNGSATEAEIDKFKLKQGQVILTKDSESWDDIGIPALVTEDMPDVLCGYHLAVLEAKAELDGSYLAWLCRSDPLNDQFKTGANGVTRYGLGQYPMKNAFIALPPLATQLRIAAFLDEKTARIDGLIAKKRALLERLAEKRQALITQAVTKGLNPAAPMKPSGIDWLGEIPAHWEVKRLKYEATYNDEVLSENTDDLEEIDYVEISGVSLTNGVEEIKQLQFYQAPSRARRKVRSGDILVSTVRTYLKAIAYIQNASNELIASTGFCVIRSASPNDPEFFGWVLRAEGFVSEVMSRSAGVSYPAINASELVNICVPCPPPKEQVEIRKKLSATVSALDNNTAKIKESIMTLTEYRSALITAAVSGQIEGLQ